MLTEVLIAKDIVFWSQKFIKQSAKSVLHEFVREYTKDTTMPLSELSGLQTGVLYRTQRKKKEEIDETRKEPIIVAPVFPVGVLQAQDLRWTRKCYQLDLQDLRK
jgi:hypothetical protein